VTGGLATAGIYHQAPVAEVSRGLVAASVIALGALLAPVITIGGRGKGLGDPESTNQPGRAEPGLDQATPDQATPDQATRDQASGAAISR
jgi:hypothetical protein